MDLAEVSEWRQTILGDPVERDEALQGLVSFCVHSDDTYAALRTSAVSGKEAATPVLLADLMVIL
jgi:hypothetical protein